MQAQKVTIFDRITGKAKLREEQMRQLELKIQYENSTKPEKQARYSVHDILGDIYYTADVELGGNPTPEIQDLITRINAQYQENYRTPSGQIESRPFSRSNLVAAKVEQKAQTGELAMIVQPNKLRGFFAARRATAEVREQNTILAQRVNQLRQQSIADVQRGNLYNLSNNIQSTSLVNFSDTLDNILSILDTFDTESEQKEEQPLSLHHFQVNDEFIGK